MKKVPFIKWLLYVSLMGVGLVLALWLGWPQEIVQNDISYLCLTIFAGFVVTTFQSGVATFYVDTPPSDLGRRKLWLRKLNHVIERNHFAAGAFTALGMVGTVIGFCVMLPAFGQVSVSEPATVQTMLKELVTGMGTALYTTLIGLVLSLLLRLQTFNIDSALNRHSDEAEVLS